MEKKRPLLAEALTQVFLKTRGILKMSQIWLPLSLILTAESRLNTDPRLQLSLYLLYAVLSKGLSGILINDLTDREIDRRSGKERWITSVHFLAGVLIPVVLLASGFIALIKAGSDTTVLAAFTATALVGTFYSLKPIRFKERGIWGILAYSFSAAILHALVPWTLFRPPFWLLPFLFVIILAEKWVQILFHQIVDYDTDSAERVRSFAVVAGSSKAEQGLGFISHVALTVDLVVLGYILYFMKEKPLFCWLIGLAGLGGIIGSFFYVRVISKKHKTTTALTEKLPWAYLGLSHVLFHVIPTLLFLALTLSEPKMGILAGLSALSLLGVSVNYFLYNPKK